MKINWNLVLSIITGITALIAIFQTSHQIKLSNKQHLFDRRINVYSIVNELIESYGTNKNLFERERTDTPQFGVTDEFFWLTNNSYMENYQKVVSHTLDETYQREFLMKLDEIHKLGIEAKLIFRGDEAKIYSDYIFCYGQSLLKMYKYQVLIEKMKKTKDMPMITKTGAVTLKDVQELVNEKSFREELYYPAIEQLKLTYNAIKTNNVERLIEEQIKLV